MPRQLELEIESLAGSGEGVARAPDGRVVFVAGSAPGDRVRVSLVEERPRFARARVDALLDAGAARVEPRCAAFGACGGCTWQHVGYAAQVEAKRRILRDALRRVGGLDPFEPPEVVPSPQPYGYRRRARVVVEGGRVGYRRRRSSELVAVHACPVLAPELEARLGRLAAEPPAQEGEWELVAGEGGAVRVVPLAPSHARAGAPAPAIRVRAGGERIGVSPGVFVQASAPLLDRLVEEVAGAAGRGTRALELHAGAGTFTLALARRFQQLLAVESDARAVADLRRNLAEAQLANVRIRRDTAERALGRSAVQRFAPEVVVLDPPRTGLGRGAAAALAALEPATVVYVSCDPATLARDLAALTRAGLRLEQVRGFDLFPQTPHVESVAVLRGAPGGREPQVRR